MFVYQDLISLFIMKRSVLYNALHFNAKFLCKKIINWYDILFQFLLFVPGRQSQCLSITVKL